MRDADHQLNKMLPGGQWHRGAAAVNRIDILACAKDLPPFCGTYSRVNRLFVCFFPTTKELDGVMAEKNNKKHTITNGKSQLWRCRRVVPQCSQTEINKQGVRSVPEVQLSVTI